jgi:hypothetical protein
MYEVAEPEIVILPYVRIVHPSHHSVYWGKPEISPNFGGAGSICGSPLDKVFQQLTKKGLRLNRCPQYFRPAWGLCAIIPFTGNKQIETFGRSNGLKSRL